MELRRKNRHITINVKFKALNDQKIKQLFSLFINQVILSLL